MKERANNPDAWSARSAQRFGGILGAVQYSNIRTDASIIAEENDTDHRQFIGSILHKTAQWEMKNPRIRLCRLATLDWRTAHG
jgi:hypothetical protein